MSDRLPARLRALATELTTFRERADLTTRTAAQRIGTSVTTLNRTENAKRVPTVAEVAGLLAIYGVVGPEQKRILTMVEEVHSPGWLERSPRLDPVVRALCDFESEARSIVNFAPSVIPGLLQTREYARAIMATGYLNEGEQVMADVRMQRQKVLCKLAAPQYTAILDEAAVRRAYGGCFVMADQLRWLIDRAKSPNISIRIIPFRHGGYHNPGYYMLLGFAQAPPVVYVEPHEMSGFLDHPDDVKLFRDNAEHLLKVSLGSTDSVNLLTRLATDFDRS
ncbi:MAG TPA: helix-turn-helix transcriptional regulator [Actinokineospora sp.]|nr:helix-turn-helix transcriptional regulator [Actinokineospora sp.]